MTCETKDQGRRYGSLCTVEQAPFVKERAPLHGDPFGNRLIEQVKKLWWSRARNVECSLSKKIGVRKLVAKCGDRQGRASASFRHKICVARMSYVILES